MILDIVHRREERELEISYIKENGQKDLMKFSTPRFKSYEFDPNGQYTNWDGAKCSVKWTSNPSKFDIKSFIAGLEPQYKKHIDAKTFPKLYAWDIEVDSPMDQQPSKYTPYAPYPVTTISVVTPNLNAVVYGTKSLTDAEIDWCKEQFHQYLENIPFYKTLSLVSEPSFSYFKFESEEEMLKFFLKNIVAKAPVLAGWNSAAFDWQYIVNRVKLYHPNLPIGLSSMTGHMQNKRFFDRFNKAFYCPVPDHTMLVDMMEVIGNESIVMPQKESLGLDSIAYNSIGANKVSYEGDLKELYANDFPRYAFYNAIDSILIQLIDKYFKTMLTTYMLGQYCTMKLDDCSSKIAMTEALVFRDFYEQGLKVVWEEKNNVRSPLLGAYVKKPVPGIHKMNCCNDFASLYPSSIITCNMSFENYMGRYLDEETLSKYTDKDKYICFGPNVFINDGKADKPEIGAKIGTFLNEEALKKFRNDKRYFVSVNGSVYNVEKESTFKRLQLVLKRTRNVSKYLSKNLDAHVMLDLEHYLKGQKPENRVYSDDEVQALKELGYDVSCSDDIEKVEDKVLFKTKLAEEIVFHTAKEQTMKLLGNSMYGGSSHISFYWYNMALANDITGEARNLTLFMEDHLSKFWRENWLKMTDWHKKWGIEVDVDKFNEIINDKYRNGLLIYGDTDSLYSTYDPLLQTIKGYENMTIKDKLDIVLKINLDFLDDHNNKVIDEYYKSRNAVSVHAFELETVSFAGVWYDVKKNYAQMLMWKDGKFYDLDDMPFKGRGMEAIKPSKPKLARNLLKKLIFHMFDIAGDRYFSQKMNIKAQELKNVWNDATIDDISETTKVNDYFMNVGHIGPNKEFTEASVDDKTYELQCKSSAGKGVKGAYMYNFIREKNNIIAPEITNGKVKVYKFRQGTVKKGKAHRDDNVYLFAYTAMNFPEWANKYAPVDRNLMYEEEVINPINRILAALHQPLLSVTGALQLSLF